ncbi:hypothetical protein SAMN05421544_10315 [Riemerella columbipharyngis]|uniref:Uncharacterized protein n=1 Tax=Riemerella columbipharyngis TaxID=1071918 RepID=A0A1G7A4C7_9FLAO|nr:hypothetical protein SAMN05421544_10315 [Riemerella columbipharyngis]
MIITYFKAIFVIGIISAIAFAFIRRYENMLISFILILASIITIYLIKKEQKLDR